MLRVFFSPGDEGGSAAAPVASAPAASASSSAPASGATSPSSTGTSATKAPVVAAGANPAAKVEVAKPTVGKVVAKPAASGPPAKVEFDVSKWDGNVDTLPETSREYARLAVDRSSVALRAEIEAAKTSGSDGEAKLAELQNELAIYKAVAEGLEDPRLGTLTEQLAKIEASSKTWQEKHEAAQKQLKAYQDADDQKWVNEFKETHKDMLADKAKSKQFFGLCEEGWEEEAAAQLVAGTPELLKEAESIVNQFKLGQDGHAFAVQHARMKLGIAVAPRTPRVAATITNGAQGGQKTGSRIEGGSVRDLPKDQARREAARSALRLVKK